MDTLAREPTAKAFLLPLMIGDHFKRKESAFCQEEKSSLLEKNPFDKLGGLLRMQVLTKVVSPEKMVAISNKCIYCL